MGARHDGAELARGGIGGKDAMRLGAQGPRAIHGIGVLGIALFGGGLAQPGEDIARRLDLFPGPLARHQHDAAVAGRGILGGQHARDRIEVAQIHAQDLHADRIARAAARRGQQGLDQAAALKLQLDHGELAGHIALDDTGRGRADRDLFRGDLLQRGQGGAGADQGNGGQNPGKSRHENRSFLKICRQRRMGRQEGPE